MTVAFWVDWVGLPWAMEADPRDGQAACCFKTAQAVREGLGLAWPRYRMAQWYSSARRNDWDSLRRDWLRLVEPIDKLEPGALVRFDQPSGSFGVGVLPNERTLITVRHQGRLLAGPTSAFRNLSLYRLK